MNVLLVRLSAIGDVVHTAPLACALKDHLPDVQITWVAERPGGELLVGHRAIDELILLPRRFLRSPGEMLRLVRRLRQIGPQVAIDAQGLTKSALVCRLSGAKRRIGFGRPWGREISRWLNNQCVDTHSVHAVLRNLELLRPLGIESPQVRFDLPELPAETAFAEELIAQLGLSPQVMSDLPCATAGLSGSANCLGATAGSSKSADHLGATAGLSGSASRAVSTATVSCGSSARNDRNAGNSIESTGDEALHASSSDSRGRPFSPTRTKGDYAMITAGAGWESKRWPAERFAAVARHLALHHGVRVLLIWGNEAERALAERVARSSGVVEVQPAPRLTLPQLAAVARRAQLFVGGDTGPLHIAAAVDTPCVGLYGPWPAAGHGPFGPKHIAVQVEYLEGSTRQRRRASRRYIESITVEAVCDACDRILQPNTVSRSR